MRQDSIVLILLCLALLAGKMGESPPKMDAMTYGALAKNVVKTGDWQTLHYASEVYPSFYQHPPLVIWLQAMVFKILPANDLTIRLLPVAFGIATVFLLYWFVAKLGGIWLGFVAGFILLTTHSYLRYASDLFLDGPLAFFILLSIVSVYFVEHEKWWASLLLGFSLAASFLTKGAVALAIPTSIGSYLVIQSIFMKKWKVFTWLSFGGAFVFSFLLLAPWYFSFGGEKYLQEYFTVSVAYRTDFPKANTLWLPFYTIGVEYWPWLPFFLWGVFKAIRSKSFGMLFVVFSLVLTAGFSVGGVFIEHYLVPFFVVAAPLTALALAPLLESFKARILNATLALGCVFLLILSIFPVKLRGDGDKDLIRLLKTSSQYCARAKRVVISDQVTSIFPAIATGLWITPFDVQHKKAKQIKARSRTLAVALKKEPLPKGWELVATSPKGKGLFQPKGTRLCKNKL